MPPAFLAVDGLIRSAKQQQVQTERHAHRLDGLGSHWPVNRMEDVVDGGNVKIGRGGSAALVDERKEGANVSMVLATRSRPLPRNSMSVRSGNGNEQAAVGTQDAPEFACIHPPRDRQGNRERAIRVRHCTVGIGHHPLALRIAPCRGINGRDRDIHAMPFQAGLSGKGAKVKAVTATGIKNNIAGRCSRISAMARHNGAVTPRACNRRRPVMATAVSPGCFDLRSCG